MLFQTRVYRQVMPKTFTEIDIVSYDNHAFNILGDPGGDSGGERKSKRAGKYGTKKSKERCFLAPIRS